MHRNPEELRELAAERAGGTAGESNYDPDLLASLCDAADEIERLRVERDELLRKLLRIQQWIEMFPVAKGKSEARSET